MEERNTVRIRSSTLATVRKITADNSLYEEHGLSVWEGLSKKAFSEPGYFLHSENQEIFQG